MLCHSVKICYYRNQARVGSVQPLHVSCLILRLRSQRSLFCQRVYTFYWTDTPTSRSKKNGDGQLLGIMFKREDLEALLDAKRNKQSTSASSSEGLELLKLRFSSVGILHYG